MPVYTYECTECKNNAETLRSMKDADLPIECPLCKQQMKRIFNPANTSFSLTGHGWFKTDGKY